MLELGRNRRHQSLADARYIRIDPRVAQQWKLLLGLRSGLSSQPHIVTRLKFVRVISDSRLGERRRGHQEDRERDLQRQQLQPKPIRLSIHHLASSIN